MNLSFQESKRYIFIFLSQQSDSFRLEHFYLRAVQIHTYALTRNGFAAHILDFYHISAVPAVYHSITVVVPSSLR